MNIASGTRRKKNCLLYFLRKVSKTEQLHFICSLSKDVHFLQQSPKVGKEGQLCAASVVYSIQDNVRLDPGLSSQMEEIKEGPSPGLPAREAVADRG